MLAVRWSSPMRARASAASSSTICATPFSSGSGRTPRARLPGRVPPSPRAVAALHLERRTGAVTKVVERGTKSIDTMLYFLLFKHRPDRNRADRGLSDLPDQVRLGLGRRHAGDVVAYVTFTRIITDWRTKMRA
jgi:hypothetical protein